MLYAYINNKRFSIEDKDNEYEIYEYIKNKYGEVKDEINDIPYYIEVSSWCFNGRCENDTYEAFDKNDNLLFNVIIKEM